MKIIQTLNSETNTIIESEIPDLLFNLVEDCCRKGHSSIIYNGDDNEITECSNNFLKEIETRNKLC